MSESNEARPLSLQVNFESAIGESTSKTKFQAQVTFASWEILLKCAGESASRLMQGPARKGKFPHGRVVPVIINNDSKLEFVMSAAEKVSLWTDEQKAELYEALRKDQEAKQAATEKLVEDEPKTVGVKPHTR